MTATSLRKIRRSQSSASVSRSATRDRNWFNATYISAVGRYATWGARAWKVGRNPTRQTTRSNKKLIQRMWDGTRALPSSRRRWRGNSHLKTGWVLLLNCRNSPVRTAKCWVVSPLMVKIRQKVPNKQRILVKSNSWERVVNSTDLWAPKTLMKFKCDKYLSKRFWREKLRCNLRCR